MIKQRPDKLGPQCRAVALRLMPMPDPDMDAAQDAADTASRVRTFAFASEEPVEMWYGTEVLSLAPGAMRSGIRQQTLPLLFNHDSSDLLGVVEGIQIGKDKVARASVRFGKDARGEWAMQQYDDGILVNASFMYRVFKFVEDTEAETLTAIDWEAFEITLCSMPADPTVGAGRSLSLRSGTEEENGVQITSAAATRQGNSAPGVSSAPGAQSATTKERSIMDETKTGTEAAGSAAATAAASTQEQNRALEVRSAEGERARITEIEALCKRYKLADEVRTGLIQRGATVDQARIAAADLVMERAATSSKSVADFGETHDPDMTTKEKSQYSMIRAVNAAINGKWDKAGFELECNNAIAKHLGRAPQNERGFFIPTNIAWSTRTAYAVGTPGAGTAGGTLVATQLLAGSFIEVLRNKARVMQLGATILSGLVGSIDIPRQTGQGNTYWTAEGTNTTESEATFDKVSLAMKTIGTYSQISRNMLMQATPDIDMIVRADLIATMALGIDLAALSGAGAPAPTGIANTGSIGSVVGGTNGAAVTIDHMIALETQLTAANAPETNLAYLANAKTVGALKLLKSTTGQYLWTGSTVGAQSGTPGEINGYPVARSNQARSTLTKGISGAVCSEIFFGAWNELIIGEWGVLEIVPNPYDAAVFKNGGVLLRVLQSLDIAVRHAASFAMMSDALTS